MLFFIKGLIVLDFVCYWLVMFWVKGCFTKTVPWANVLYVTTGMHWLIPIHVFLCVTYVICLWMLIIIVTQRPTYERCETNVKYMLSSLKMLCLMVFLFHLNQSLYWYKFPLRIEDDLICMIFSDNFKLKLINTLRLCISGEKLISFQPLGGNSVSLRSYCSQGNILGIIHC